MVNRREVLRSAGAFATIGTVGVIPGSASENVGTEELGLNKEIESLMLEGKSDEVQNLLDKNDVTYSYAGKEVGGETTGEVSPEWNFEKDRDNLMMVLSLDSADDDLWTAYGTALFSGDSYESSNGIPNKVDDGCGIIFDHSEWTSMNPSESGVRYSDTDYIDIYHEEYNPNYGPVAKVDYHPGNARDCSAMMSCTQLTRVDSGNDNPPVQFAYEHSIALTGLTGSTSVSINAGALEVDLPLGASTAWEAEICTKPDGDCE